MVHRPAMHKVSASKINLLNWFKYADTLQCIYQGIKKNKTTIITYR